MKEDVIQSLLKEYGLGEMIAPVSKLSGGALHTMLHVKTKQKEYAIKGINPHIQEKKEFPGNYNVTEEIATRFASNGLPAVTAMEFDGNYVLTRNNQSFLIYPYIEGSVLHHNQITVEHGKRVGELFAIMHNLNLHMTGCEGAEYLLFSNSHWQNLIDKVGFPDLKALENYILSANDNYRGVIPSLENCSVLTHRDMHYKNMLWQDITPYIIDWESAGLMNPFMEVIGYALEWSGILLEQTIDYELFSTIYSRYLSKQSLVNDGLVDVEKSFYGWLGHCVLGWTEFNLRRMLGQTSVDKEEIQRGHEIIETKMIPTLALLKSQERVIIERIQ